MVLFRPRRVGVLVAAALLAAPPALATAYPTKPIRLIVPFPPGGGTDVIARAIAPRLTQYLGQPIVIDNRGGANSNIGTDLAAKAPPDGYTLLMVTANLTINVSLYKNLPFDVVRDFAPITELAASAFVLVTHPTVKANNVRELIELAKAPGARLNYASNGNGSPAHIAAEMLRTHAKIDVTHVPYKGSGPAVTDLMGNHVQMMFGSMASTLPYVKAGRLKALGVTSAKRATAAPELPTMIESGLKGFEITTWYGMFAPRATAMPIVRRVQAEAVKTINEPDLRQFFAGQGLEVVGSTPEAYAALVKAEIAKFADVVKASGAKPD